MYAKEDPRSTLAAATASPPGQGAAIAAAQYFDLVPPDAATPDGRTVVVRAQNVALALTDVRAGDRLDNGTPDGEVAVVVTDGTPAFRVQSDDGERLIDSPGLVVLPPGPSGLAVHGDGTVIRLFEADEPAWRDRAVNAEAYARDHPRVAPLRRWPEPAGGRATRFYPLADVPDDPDRFGRIFRTRSFMVNFLPPQGPRDPAKLSPHTHDDFEQLSLAVRGSFVHHIRTPWLNDSTVWRDDEHVTLGSPSVAIIPPPTVHTSAATDPDGNQLIDIFSPPRTDFSRKPGWVLNADDYPMP